MRISDKDRKTSGEVPGAGDGKEGLFGDGAFFNRFLPGGGPTASLVFVRGFHAVLLGGLRQHLFLF
jgi:hypothetical protein